MDPEKFTDVRLRYEKSVARITINRPDKLNAIRIQTYRELTSAFQIADNSPDCKLILLDGEGGTFTAGNDLSDLVGVESTQQVTECVQNIFDTISSLKKVLIMVVEGVAVGIGTTLLLHSDIVVASEKTRFRLPFVNLGVCPEGGSSALLSEVIGPKRANEILLTGRFFTAEQAMRWGLINKITQAGEAADGAVEYIELLLPQPLSSLVATKKLLRGQQKDVNKVVASELVVFGELLASQKTQQRIQALLKK